MIEQTRAGQISVLHNRFIRELSGTSHVMTMQAMPRNYKLSEHISEVGEPSRFLSFALLACSLATLGSLLFLGIYHVSDLYYINHVADIWIELARLLNTGKLFPDLYDGTTYGGVRFMPLYFTLHAGLARVTGEYIVSGKLLSYFLAIALWMLFFRIAADRAGSAVIALALTALTASSTVSVIANMTIRADLLPVLLQLGAVACLARTRTQTRAVISGLLCCLALTSKVTAIWAPLAIAIHLLGNRDFRLLALFTVTLTVSLGGSVLLFQWLSSGRLIANFSIRTAVSPVYLLKSPFRLLRMSSDGGTLLPVLLPLATFEMLAAFRTRRVTIYHTSFLAAILVVLVIFADQLTTENHLLDVIVLAGIMAAFSWTTMKTAARVALEFIAITIVTSLVLNWAGTLASDAREAILALRSGVPAPQYSRRPLAGIIRGGENVLTEYPYIAISEGRTPIIVDPCSLPVMERLHPEWVDELAGKIRKRAFDKIVLLFPLHRGLEVNDRWYSTHLGLTVAQAIRSHYEFSVTKNRYQIYVPRAARAVEPGTEDRSAGPG